MSGSGSQKTLNNLQHTVYLLRGLAREARHWGGFAERLQTAFEARGCRVRVICLDLPGAGQHSEMISPPSIEGIAEFVDRQIEWLEPSPANRSAREKGIVHIVGMSLGGMVSLKLAEIRPSGFDSAVVINTSARNIGSLTERMQPKAVLGIADIVRTRSIRSREAKILELVANSSSARSAVLDAWERIQLTRPIALWNFSLQLAAAARFEIPLKLSVPLLVVASEKDRLVHPNCSARLAKFYDAKLISHPEAGHDIAVDQPEWLAERLADWGVEIEVQRQNQVSIL